MPQNDSFSRRQEQAVEEMREMSRKAAGTFKNMPPTPPFVRIPNKTSENNLKAEAGSFGFKRNDGINDFLNTMNLPFLNGLKNDGDMGLVLGLLLILINEKSDRLLMFALLYILM